MSPHSANNAPRTGRPPMKPSNNPDVAIAQEWIGELDTWYEAHGLAGYDPFDIKQHPWVRSVQQRPLLRKAVSAACDAFPFSARRALSIRPTENPKAFALMAQGSLQMHALTGEDRYKTRAEGLLQWLLEHPAEGKGLAWGYPFDVRGRGVDTPAGTPVGVVSAIAGQAFLSAYESLGLPAYAAPVRAIAEFFLTGLSRLPQEDGTVCFAYAPTDLRRVHNANLLAAEFLYRAAAVLGEPDWRPAAEPALEFTLRRQRDDGAWPYGEWHDGEVFEPAIMRMIDHHHTGFVLRSLHGIGQVTKDARVVDAMNRGITYYRTLFCANGAPRTAHGRYPIDVHACAEAILCPSALSDRCLPARPLAINALRWAHWHMRDQKTGAPYYRVYPLFTSRITYPRWGVAWMYRALAEYLSHSYPRSARKDD